MPKSAFSFQEVNTNNQEADSLTQKYIFAKFEVEPDTAFIYLDRDYNKVIKVVDGDSLKFTSGFHNLFIFAENIPERRISKKFEPSEEHVISVRKIRAELTSENYSAYAAYRWGANLMILTDSETAISVVGTNHFSYGLMKAKLPPGAHKIRFERPSGKTYERFVEVNSYQMITIEEYFKPLKATSTIAGFLPGASQFYKGEPIKGLSAIVLVGGAIGAALHFNSRISSKENEFLILRRLYRESTREQTALELGNQLDDLGGEINGIKRRRNVFRAAAVVFYAVNLFDAFREPENGFAEVKTFDPFRDFSFNINSEGVEARVQFNF